MPHLDWYWVRWKPVILLYMIYVQVILCGGSNGTNLASFKKPSAAQSCSKVTQFASSVAAFTYCSLTTSQNMLCRKCQDEMTGIYDNYLSINTMIPDVSSVGSSEVCSEDIITPKKLSDIHFYFKQTESIWLTGNCDSEY